MTDDTRLPSFDHAGQSYPLVWPSDFALGEIVDTENFFGADYSSDVLDGRKIAAMIFVSMRRVEPRVSAATVKAMTAADLETLRSTVAAVVDDSPPEIRAENESEPSLSAPASNDAPVTESASSPNGTGDPNLDTSSDSDPATLPI